HQHPPPPAAYSSQSVTSPVSRHLSPKQVPLRGLCVLVLAHCWYSGHRTWGLMASPADAEMLAGCHKTKERKQALHTLNLSETRKQPRPWLPSKASATKSCRPQKEDSTLCLSPENGMKIS
ncbi:hypothetical protein H1C71_025596, partial [Ictidomys tridecemlineatus]